MIIENTNRIYVIYIRTNRRVKWQYSEYKGRYESPEQALEIVKERMGDVPYEYRIECLADDSVVTGFVNWEHRTTRKQTTGRQTAAHEKE